MQAAVFRLGVQHARLMLGLGPRHRFLGALLPIVRVGVSRRNGCQHCASEKVLFHVCSEGFYPTVMKARSAA
jgi:hypothetical protein